MIDPPGALLRLLGDRVGTMAQVRLHSSSSVAWASATFTGARHELIVTIGGADAEAAADRATAHLEVEIFDCGRQLVADVAVTGREATLDGVVLTIGMLTIDEA